MQPRWDTPVEIAGKRLEWFNYRHFSFDPSMAPAGKAVVSCFLPADWEYWRKLGDDRASYKAEKDRIARFCVEQIEKRVPGLEGMYMASMWTSPPGGIPGAARAGRDVAQLICRKDDMRFKALID